MISMDRPRQRPAYRSLSAHPQLQQGRRSGAALPASSSGAEGARAAPRAASRESTPVGERLYREAVPRRATMFAVVDAASCPDVLSELESYDGASESLFDGRNADALKEAAPYLVEFRPHTGFSKWWFGQWGNHAGILIEAPTTLNRLRSHLRTLLIVGGESERRFYFRFYDPRVLCVYLPECDAEGTERFFGPASAFYCEGDSENELLAFRVGDNGATMRRHTAAPS